MSLWVYRRPEREDPHHPIELRLVRRLFAYTRPYARKRNLLLLLVALRSLQLPALGWAVGAILSGPVTRHDSRGVLLGALGFLSLVLFTELTFVYRMRLALELGESVVHDLRNDVFAKVLAMPISFFHRMPLGRLIGRVTSDVDSIRLGIQDCVFVGVVQLGTMAAAAAMMAVYDASLFLVVLALVPVLWALLRHFHRKLGDAHRRVQESFSRVTITLAESVSGMRVIQGYGRQDLTGGMFRSLIHEHSRNNLGVARENAVFGPLLEFNGQLFLALLLVVGGWQALGGDVGLPALIHFFFLANLFFNPIPVLAQQYNQALSSMAGAERLFRLLDSAPDWTDRADARAVGPLQGRVEMRDVGFEYQPGNPVLQGVSFVAEPGQTVAIVGETGGGKSTIMGLIAKFHLPTAGEVLIDGSDVRTLDATSLRRRMGNVFQSNFLFTGTVLDNLRLGRPDASVDDVRAAARALDVLDLLESLPQGLESPVGERGGNLSLGQRQIVCFTRAMLADPAILLLDEATSGLDVVTEARLQRALAALLRGRTSFVVAHRLSTIRHADQILVVERGRIVERGTFRELLVRGGVFARLHAEATAGLLPAGA